jgi:hypothetical protein
MRNALLLAASIGLSGCAVVPPPAAAPAPIVIPAPPPPAPAPALLPSDWRERPFAQGSWSLVQKDTGSVAQFGHPGRPADFLVRCQAMSKNLLFSRAGSIPESVAAVMTLASTDTKRAYAATNGSEAPPHIWSETPANDPQLDSLAFSRGRILVSVAGTDDLVIPSWPEFARVVEECRG